MFDFRARTILHNANFLFIFNEFIEINFVKKLALLAVNVICTFSIIKKYNTYVSSCFL